MPEPLKEIRRRPQHRGDHGRLKRESGASADALRSEVPSCMGDRSNEDQYQRERRHGSVLPQSVRSLLCCRGRSVERYSANN